MLTKRFSIILFALCTLGFCQLQASAQGGWRQWDIHLLDGTTRLATPLATNEKGQFTFSMGKEPAIDRSKISYLAIRANDLPQVPDGQFDKDLVVMLDGTRLFGAITFRDIKFSEGTIVQNGKKMTLEKVAYIKFAQPKKKAQKPRRSTT